MFLELGDAGPITQRWRQLMNAMYGQLYESLHGPLPGNRNDFDGQAKAWQEEYERRTGQTVDGIVSEQDLADLKLVLPHRPIWIYSAPGSGAPGYIGPSFDLGEWCRAILNLNHVWLDYPIGGYLGLMGGDPRYSYDDVVGFVEVALEAALDRDPDLQRTLAKRKADPKAVLVNGVDWEGWLSGYSQSADAIKRAAVVLFGPGGKYELAADRLNGVIVFGDPTTPGTGIARLVWASPDWLNRITTVINNPSPTPDFYGVANDPIRPLFYEWFTKAETELPFVVYTAQIIIPALLNLIAPFLGGALTGPLAIPLLSSATGLGVETLGPMIGGIAAAKSKPNPELIKLLSVQGFLTNLPALLTLAAALPGIAVHGNYYEPKPEWAVPAKGWGPRSGIQVGFDTIGAFRR